MLALERRFRNNSLPKEDWDVPRLTKEIWNRIVKNDLPENFVNDKRKYYWLVYLKSDHWLDLRARKLAANPVCEKCGARRRVEPHHLRYKNLYDVELEDLQTLCRRCHWLEHEKLRQQKILQFKGFVGGVPQTPKQPP